MRLFLLCMLAVSVFTTGCSTTKAAKERIADNPSCRTLPASPMPGWILGSSTGSTGVYYGVGVSEGLDMSFSEMKATSRSNANAELAQSLEVRIQSAVREEVTGSAEGDYNKKVKGIIESNSDLLISGSEVDSIWLNRETCQLWTRVKLSKKEAERSKSEMKSLVLQQLEAASKDVASIKSTIESDPNVILRKYGLTINSMDYYRAVNLSLPKDDFNQVLDLYKKYGVSQYEGYSYLGFPVEEYFDFSMSVFGYAPKESMNFIQASMASKGREGLVAKLLEYDRDYEKKEIPVRFMDSNRFTKWYKSEYEKLNKEHEMVYARHNNKVDKLGDKYRSGRISRTEYEKNMKALEKELDEESKSYDPRFEELNFHNSQIHGGKRASFNDSLYLVHIASCYGSKKGLSIIKDAGFSMKKVTEKGYSPLQIAKYCENKEAVRYLSRI